MFLRASRRMKLIPIRLVSAVVLAVFGSATLLFGQAQTNFSKRRAQEVSITAKVTAIDYTTREVTLKGPLGNMVTFTVDKQVQRLNEIKVGDDVTAEYYVSLAADVRLPSAEEKANPFKVLEETAKAPEGTSPAAGALRVMRVLVTIEGLDRPTRSITVSGPKGNLLTVQVEDVSALSKVRLGDQMVVTYTEALAVSLQKQVKK
jgi:Cu/Ag efflux protein CusF